MTFEIGDLVELDETFYSEMYRGKPEFSDIFIVIKYEYDTDLVTVYSQRLQTEDKYFGVVLRKL